MEIIVIYQIRYEERNKYGDDTGRPVLNSHRRCPDTQIKSRSLVQSTNRHITGETTYWAYRYFVYNLRSKVHPLFAGANFCQ